MSPLNTSSGLTYLFETDKKKHIDLKKPCWDTGKKLEMCSGSYGIVLLFHFFCCSGSEIYVGSRRCVGLVGLKLYNMGVFVFLRIEDTFENYCVWTSRLNTFRAGNEISIMRFGLIANDYDFDKGYEYIENVVGQVAAEKIELPPESLSSQLHPIRHKNINKYIFLKYLRKLFQPFGYY
ncbi:hypothetical protein BDA99DRAFT_534002 [Phascolomyces articulosus]|uniref:Uncharacterized protein n=1 Tax=Phascolomyces articulosus TaxID=60185 RepID=A0AAD5KHT4_9FUNG|nr:hypothetical protein BDA99DRAFT_534002 [Phascolomyces articulosus]